MSTESFVVDRVEGSTAVIVSDAGDHVDVPISSLPTGTTEGDVLTVARDPDGHLDFESMKIDRVETSRRLEEASRVIDELRSRDPGGDIVL